MALPLAALAALAAAAPQPNLVLTHLAAQECRSAGPCLSVHVANRGERSTPRRPAVTFWLSADRRLSRDDRRLRYRLRLQGRLAPGRVSRWAVGVDVGDHVRAGGSVIACVDRERRIRESNERDNCRITR